MVKKEKKEKGLIGKLKEKIKSKRILKKQPQVQVRIKDYKQPSILGDPNRFFKDEWNETVKSL